MAMPSPSAEIGPYCQSSSVGVWPAGSTMYCWPFTVGSTLTLLVSPTVFAVGCAGFSGAA